MTAAQTPKDREVAQLLDTVLNLAVDKSAPTADMAPLAIIINALGVAVDDRHDADIVLASLVGTLAWIARRHWPEVSAEIRNLTGEVMQ